MTTNKGGRGKRDPNAIRKTGWRLPRVEGAYQDLVFTIMSRPEFRGCSTRAVVEAALREFAKAEELDEVGLTK